MKRLDFIDFAKGFSILSIVIFHYSQPYASGFWSKLITFGGSGVHMFFFLSGFGLGIAYIKINVVDFYIKRFLKILIPYYLTIITIFFTNFTPPPLNYISSNLYALGGHIFLYKMFDESIMVSYGYHFWFISTIIQFYLVFPLILKIKNYLSVPQFLIYSTVLSLLYSAVISYFNLHTFRIFNSFFLQYLWEFNLGIALGQIYIASGNVIWNKNLIYLALCCIFGVGLTSVMVLYGGMYGRVFNDIPAFIGYSSLVVLAYKLTSASGVGHKFLNYLGGFSYEFYLIHMIVFTLFNTFITEKLILVDSIITALLIVLPISIIAAKYFSLFVNKISLTRR